MIYQIIKFIPNTLTLLRLFLAFLYPFAIGEKFRLGILMVALITEFLDGYLSRKMKATSKFGTIMDPVADKTFFASVALCAILEGKIELWQLAVISLREMTVLFGTLVLVIVRAGQKRDLKFISRMRPNIWGKVTTALHYLVFFNLLLLDGLNGALLGMIFSAGLIASYLYVQFALKEFTVQPHKISHHPGQEGKNEAKDQGERHES